MTRWLPLLFLVVWTGALFSQSEPITPEANPGRPIVSTPATLTPIGYLELVNETTRRAQFGQTLSISHPVKRFIVSGEIWHFTQPFLHGHAIGNLWAIAYPIRKNLVVDTGFDRGLTSTSTQWETFAGFTFLLPHRLW